MILAERAARLVSEIAVERLKLEVARLRRERFGTSSERSARIDQLELALENLEETLAETEAQAAAEPDALPSAASSRRKPARRPLPEHLPRERVVHPGPTTCACCGGTAAISSTGMAISSGSGIRLGRKSRMKNSSAARCSAADSPTQNRMPRKADIVLPRRVLSGGLWLLCARACQRCGGRGRGGAAWGLFGQQGHAGEAT